MKRGLLPLFLCIFFLTGCVYDKVAVVERPMEYGISSMKSVTRQYKSLADNIAIYENKLLYSRNSYGTDVYYVLDFETGIIHNLGEGIDGDGGIRGSALVDDTFYFYTDVFVDYDTLRNVLFACDLSDYEISLVSGNKYTKHKIPLTGFENKLYALQANQGYDIYRNKDNYAKIETYINMDYDHFLQVIDEKGNAENLTLLQDEVGIPNIKEALEGQHQILCIDSDTENIIALEGMDTDGITKYYVTKYTSDYNCVFAQDISNIFEDYTINKRISAFYAFGDYFMLSDLYGTSILCRFKGNGIEVIFCKSNIEYARNYYKNGEFEHFYIPETNDIYRLDLRTGVLESQDYEWDNEKYVIRNILAYDDKLMVSMYTGEADCEEIIYLISLD